MLVMVISLILLLLGIVGCLYLIYLKYFHRYTRERFAFSGVAVMSALFSSLMLQIYSSQGYVSALINTSNFFLDTHLESYQSDAKDHIITTIGFGFLMVFIYKVHRNWNGPISEVQFNEMRFNVNPTLLHEAYLQLKDFFLKEKAIVPHVKSGKEKYLNVFSDQDIGKLPWHENVFELLTFSNPQYKVDLIQDWYPDEQCFISKYGQDKEKIAILCCIDYPNNNVIRNFIRFAKSQKGKVSKLIIAIKNHDHKLEKITKFETELIIRNENEMLGSLIDFSSYTQFIKEQFSEKEISLGTNITLEDIYVPLRAENDNHHPIDDIETYVYDWLNQNLDNKHLAILGEYGCGKSVLSLKVAHDLLQNRSEKSRIPILIELRGKSPRNLNVTEILSTWASNYRLDAASLLKLHHGGKLLIIFEGFDEMDMIGDREMRLNHFQRLWEFATPKSKIMITGRPNFFLDDKELKMNLGIDRPHDNSHYCEALHLKKFDIHEIKHALRNIDGNTRTQVIEILEKSTNSNFYDLVSRPAILYLIAVIWQERGLVELKDRINSAVVISEFIKYSYSRQSSKQGKFPLIEKEREYFMLGIAVGMLWATEFSNQIGKADLENIILKLYRSFPAEITAFETAMEEPRKPLKERMMDNNTAEDTILTDVRSCGIIVNDITRKDYFKFAHKSFLEYQASLFFVESLLQDKQAYNLMMNAIANALDIAYGSFRHSQETISFTSEILISKLNLSKADEPKKVCKRLFTILYPNKFLGKVPRTATIIEMLSSSSLFTLLNASAGVAISYWIYYAFLSDDTLKGIQPILIVFMFMFGVIVTLFIRILSGPRSRKRMTIWFKCCEELNIPLEVIETVVPPRYVSFLEGKALFDPFVYVAHRLQKFSKTLAKVERN